MGSGVCQRTRPALVTSIAHVRWGGGLHVDQAPLAPLQPVSPDAAQAHARPASHARWRGQTMHLGRIQAAAGPQPAGHETVTPPIGRPVRGPLNMPFVVFPSGRPGGYCRRHLHTLGHLTTRPRRRHSSLMEPFPVPRLLADTAATEPGVREWIGRLPGIVASLADRWSLRIGEPFQPGGQCAWVAPATGPDGASLVLKVGYRFPSGEERDEAAGLRIWDGNGSVRLHAVHESESSHALLIERCLPGTPLGRALPEPEQDLVVAGLLRQLWARSPGEYPFRPLAQMCAAWADEFEKDYAAADPASRLDPGLARAGITLFRELPASADRQVLLCTDLHGENILAAERAPWLAIDPKPYVGDPAYDVLQHMLNCDDRLAADPAGLATRMAGLAGVDPERARQWLFARSVQESACSALMRQVATALAP